MSLIKCFDVGSGDMFYIVHGTSSFTIIDCNMSEDNEKEIIDELKEAASEKIIRRFISTHPDEDHFCGLKYLDDNMEILNFYCVKNETTKKDVTEDFERYCELRDSQKAFHIYKGCERCWLNKNDDDKKCRSSGLDILWPDTNNEEYITELSRAKEGYSPNNISAIIQYSLNESVKVLWFGDLENSFMEKIKDEVDLPNADIIFAPHHGRKSGKIPKEWLDKINPKIIVIGNAPFEEIDYTYSSNYNTITQNSAGDVIFDCSRGTVDVYVSKKGYTVDFLEDENKPNAYDKIYLGTLYL